MVQLVDDLYRAYLALISSTQIRLSFPQATDLSKDFKNKAEHIVVHLFEKPQCFVSSVVHRPLPRKLGMQPAKFFSLQQR
jgi:hypothetical protein